MNTNELHDPRQSGAPDSPGDIPAERPATLDRLHVLIGRWEMDASLRPVKEVIMSHISTTTAAVGTQ